MATTKEIRQVVDEKTWIDLVECESALEMREWVKHNLVPHILWFNWFGCRIATEENERVLYHRVSIDCDFIPNSIR